MSKNFLSSILLVGAMSVCYFSLDIISAVREAPEKQIKSVELQDVEKSVISKK